MTEQTWFRVVAPCLTAYCITCEHPHDGGPCTARVTHVIDTDHGPADIGRECGCATFTREAEPRCAFTCDCAYPGCDCTTHCRRHADAILAHRGDPDHPLHALALTAHHPGD